MKLPAYLAFFLVLQLVLVACRTPAISASDEATPKIPDPDVVPLMALSAQARELAYAEVPDPVLRQLSTDLHTTTFYFTDEAATVEVDVSVPEPGIPSAEWDVAVLTLGKLVGHSGMELGLDALKLGPRRVAQAMKEQWPGCTIRSMSLIEQENALAWVGFCNTAAGVVSGSMDNDSGIFHPSASPPARVPATATRRAASVAPSGP